MAVRRLRPWMTIALVIGVACCAGAGIWYAITAPKMPRVAPALDLRLQASGARLRRPQTVSPTEEHPRPDGEIVYLTQDQFRAANAAATLPQAGYDRKLAAALAEENPERRIEQLVAIMDSVPRDASGDVTALGLYALVSGALHQPPPSDAQTNARKKIEGEIGCRFVQRTKQAFPLPKCESPPTMVPAYVLAGVGAAPLLLVLAAMLARRKPAASREVPAGSANEAA